MEWACFMQRSLLTGVLKTDTLNVSETFQENAIKGPLDLKIQTLCLQRYYKLTPLQTFFF